MKPLSLQRSFRGNSTNIHSLKLLHLRFTGKLEWKSKFLSDADWEDDDGNGLNRPFGTVPVYEKTESEGKQEED